ncbi:MAG: CRISPR-associated endonuclease Cas1 [Desulfobacca sp.]|nr:CRISPR-associated endonuclease Cas1 [Desulfobacca sp.]
MGAIFDQLGQIATLRQAWLQVLKKGARGGLDGVQPQDLEQEIDQTLGRLAEDLRQQRYVPIPYAKGAMPKFDENREWRKLSLPAVVDKIVQQALVNLIEPIFDKEFLDTSYAYRHGKGPVRAIKRIEHICRSARVRFVATADIDKFFDTLDQELLLQKVGARLQEPEIVSLISRWLKAGMVSSKGDWEETEAGIAQGGVISPLLSNIYLHPLDQLAAAQRYHYLRYSDNFILLSENKDRLYAAYEQLQGFLTKALKLKLNENPYPFKDIRGGFVFLGIYLKGDERRISQAKEKKTIFKLNWLTERRRQRDPETFLKKLNESVTSARRYYAFINPAEQFAAFDRHLFKRLGGLLKYFNQKGWLSSPEELAAFTQRIEFYQIPPGPEREKVCRRLVAEATTPLPETPSRKAAGEPAPPADQDKKTRRPEAQAARARRTTAQRSRFLRRVADQTEVIISSPGIFLGKTSGRLIVREQRRNVLECPFHKMRHLSIGAKGISLSSDLVLECCRQDIPITFYNFRGHPEAVLHSPLHSLGGISVEQLRIYETDKALELVKKLLTGKTKNQINLIKFYLRHRKKTDLDFARKAEVNIQNMLDNLQALLKIEKSEVFSITRDQLFAAEARISLRYWDCMKALVSPELGFVKRTHRKAADLVNHMLNYGYGILYQRVWRAVLKMGLNPHISFLHAFQARKPTLVYDLVEEYRQPFVDRAIFSFLTRGKEGSDLRLDTDTGLLAQDTRNQVIKAVLARLSGLIPFRGKKVQGEEIIEIQTRNLVAFLEGNQGYRPFIATY